MKYFFLITIKNGIGQMLRFGIVSSTKAAAEAEAQRLAGVGPEIEPETVQKSEVCHSVID